MCVSLRLPAHLQDRDRHAEIDEFTIEDEVFERANTRNARKDHKAENVASWFVVACDCHVAHVDRPGSSPGQCHRPSGGALIGDEKTVSANFGLLSAGTCGYDMTSRSGWLSSA